MVSEPNHNWNYPKVHLSLLIVGNVVEALFTVGESIVYSRGKHCLQ